MLTNTQIVDTRRFMGYGLIGNSATQIYSLPAYSRVGVAGAWVGISLVDRVANLQPEEETVLINIYLVPLNTMEAAIASAGLNLDTDVAAVWTHNKNEVADRTKLFNSTRLRLCAFMGFAPGAELSGGIGARIVRT